MPPKTIRIMTWNVHGSARPRPEALAEVVARTRVDIVGLQEIRRGQAAHMAAILGMTHHWSLKHNPFAPFASMAEGLAVMVRGSISRASSVEITRSVSRRSHARRIVQTVRTVVDGQAMSIVNTHLASHHAAHERIGQAQRVRSVIDSESPHPVVVTGDLNDDGEPDVVRAVSGHSLTDSWAAVHGELGGYTCPAYLPTTRLDHVLVPASAEIVSTSVVYLADGSLSDHLPVVAEIDM